MNQLDEIRRDGVRHGNWIQGAGPIRVPKIQRLPLRARYTARTQREAVLAFARLVSEDEIAATIMQTTREK